MIETNKIYCENCLDTMARMPDGFVDLVVTSPPYDNLRKYNGYSFDFEAVAKELFRVVKTGGVVVWVVGDATVNGSETGTSFRQALHFMEVGFNLHDTLIYQKSGFPFPEINRYNPVFEYMFVLSNGKPKTANLIQDKKNRYVGEKMARQKSDRQTNGQIKENSAWRNNRGKLVKEFGVRDNVWQYATGSGNSSNDKLAFLHPATFPEQLAADHIYSWSNEGNLVYDPFMGSGTTAKMAHLQNRKWIGSEISAEYVALAEKRIKPYLIQTKLEL